MIYDPTIFVGKSVDEVITTIFIAILLVVGVVFLFLQSWRAAHHPGDRNPGVAGRHLHHPADALGISLNNLSLFGARACGRHRRRRRHRGGRRTSSAMWKAAWRLPRPPHVTTDEVGGALISIALTCCARCSFPRPSCPASPGSSSASSR